MHRSEMFLLTTLLLTFFPLSGSGSSGHDSCKCRDSHPSSMDQHKRFLDEEYCLVYEAPTNVLNCLPIDFGIKKCAQWSLLHNPECKENPAGWCYNEWCYVEDDCASSTGFTVEQTEGKGGLLDVSALGNRTVHYSYFTCDFSFRVVVGTQANVANNPPQCYPWNTGERIGTQCCNPKDRDEKALRPDCKAGQTQVEAQAHCDAKEYRLCTEEEVTMYFGTGTGCEFDSILTWTSTPCEGDSVTTVTTEAPVASTVTTAAPADAATVADAASSASPGGSTSATSLTTSPPSKAYYNDKCSDTQLCTEGEPRHHDEDCCAATNNAGCEAGFDFSYGDSCGQDVRKTCCTGCPVTGACLEDGRGDEDCCGHKDVTSCVEGYAYSRGESCGDNETYRTCCIKGGVEEKEDDVAQTILIIVFLIILPILGTIASAYAIFWWCCIRSENIRQVARQELTATRI